MDHSLIILLLSSTLAHNPQLSTCQRYDTLDKSTGTCVIRHPYVRTLVFITMLTFLLNFVTKCQRENWYTVFFFYNIVVCLVVGAQTTFMAGGPISDTSFYTMSAFVALGTLALFLNLVTVVWWYVKCKHPVNQTGLVKLEVDQVV